MRLTLTKAYLFVTIGCAVCIFWPLSAQQNPAPKTTTPKVKQVIVNCHGHPYNDNNEINAFCNDLMKLQEAVNKAPAASKTPGCLEPSLTTELDALNPAFPSNQQTVISALRPTMAFQQIKASTLQAASQLSDQLRPDQQLAAPPSVGATTSLVTKAGSAELLLSPLMPARLHVRSTARPPRSQPMLTSSLESLPASARIAS